MTPAGNLIDVEETYHNHLVLTHGDRVVKITTREVLHDCLDETLADVDQQILKMAKEIPDATI
jgi:hypothetical protein